MMYADENYYAEHQRGDLSGAELKSYLTRASLYIDCLTYNRIRVITFEQLKSWQQTVIQEVTCAYANWLHDNQAMLETYLKSYSINGVSMTMDGAWNVHIENGVAIRSDLYELLESTGLCCANFNWGAWQYE